MKFLETHFEEYINETEHNNLHSKLTKTYSRFTKTLDKLGNLICHKKIQSI